MGQAPSLRRVIPLAAMATVATVASSGGVAAIPALASAGVAWSATIPQTLTRLLGRV
jgi:hypothetical protein